MADVNGDADVIIKDVGPLTVAPIPVSFSIYDGGVALPTASENDFRATAAAGGAARYGETLTCKAYYKSVIQSWPVTISHIPASFVTESVQHVTLPVGSGADEASHIEFKIVTLKPQSPQGTQPAYVTLTIDTPCDPVTQSRTYVITD